MTDSLRFRLVALWSTVGIFLAASGMYFVTAIIIGAPAIELDPVASGGVYFVMAACFYLLVVRRRGSERIREAFSIRPVPVVLRSYVLLAGASTILLAPCLAALNSRIFPDRVHSPDALNDLLGQPLGWLPFLCVSILIAPVVEELVDRGWLQPRLEKLWGAPAAIALSSLFFGLGHLVLWMTPYFTIVGAMLGYVVYATRSVWAGIILHMAFNASLVTLGMLGAGEIFMTWVEATGPVAWIAPMGILVIIGFMIHIDRSRRALTCSKLHSLHPKISVMT